MIPSTHRVTNNQTCTIVVDATKGDWVEYWVGRGRKGGGGGKLKHCIGHGIDDPACIQLQYA